jgi:hypothetical protein
VQAPDLRDTSGNVLLGFLVYPRERRPWAFGSGTETWEKVVPVDLSRQQIVKQLRRVGLNEVADDAEATLPEQVPEQVLDQFCTSHSLSVSSLMDLMGASP